MSVRVSVERFKELILAEEMMKRLDAWGVDNFPYYGEAIEGQCGNPCLWDELDGIYEREISKQIQEFEVMLELEGTWRLELVDGSRILLTKPGSSIKLYLTRFTGLMEPTGDDHVSISSADFRDITKIQENMEYFIKKLVN